MLSFTTTKLLFLDIDGVLSIPRYYSDKRDTVLTCGMPEEDWFRMCNTNNDVYMDCGVPKGVVKILRDAKKNGIEFYALTVETNSGEYFNKVNFLKTRYPAYFKSYEKVLFVDKPTDKVKMLETYTKEFGVCKSDVVLIDDSFDICLQVANAGYKAIHVSELLAN